MNGDDAAATLLFALICAIMGTTKCRWRTCQAASLFAFIASLFAFIALLFAFAVKTFVHTASANVATIW